MSSWVMRKILKETAANKWGAKEDIYFESVPAKRLGVFNTTKKRAKATPAGLSDHDAQVLTKVKRRAYRLDMCLFNLCGIRFGWSSVIGIVPVIGDVLDVLLALMIVRTCQQVEGGLPSGVKSKMVFNIVLDFVVGLVPILGDLVDAMFRANTRNAAVLEDYLREKGKKNMRKSGVPLPAVDPSDPVEFDRREEMRTSPGYTMQPPSRQQMSTVSQSHSRRGTMPSQPAQARVRDHGRSGRAHPASRGSSRPRNDLRDMEEGVVSHHPSTASRHQRQVSRNSSRRG